MRLLFFLVLVALLQITCLDRNDQSEVRMGQAVQADLIVVFNPNVSLDDRTRFNEETIGRRVPGRDGVSFLNGIEASLALANLCSNQQGIALKLRPNITDDQLQEIKRAISNSPIVYRLIENTEPTRVKCPSSGNSSLQLGSKARPFHIRLPGGTKLELN